MSTVWIVSIALQWVVIAALVAVVLSLVRQLGVLNLRLAGRLREGEPERLELYDVPDAAPVPLLGGGGLELGGERTAPVLVVFLRPGCSGCAGLHAPLRELASTAPGADVLLVLDAEEAAASTYRREAALERLPSAILAALPPVWAPRGTPAAIALSAEGIVAAEGRPRSGADLEELLHVAREAVLVAGPDSALEHPWGRSVPYWHPTHPATAGTGTAQAPALPVVHDRGKGPAARAR